MPENRGTSRDPVTSSRSALRLRNLSLDGRRTSVRLEPDLWDALLDIAAREQRSLHDLCAGIDRTRGRVRLTSALRIYIVNYFRAAATEPKSRPPAARAEGQAGSPPL